MRDALASAQASELVLRKRNASQPFNSPKPNLHLVFNGGQSGIPGVVVGGWMVTLQASPSPSEFTPVSFKWSTDTGETATGQIVTVFLPIAAKGQPLVYTHTVSVTASDAQGDTASASYTLMFSKPQAVLAYAVDPQSKNQTKMWQWGSGLDWTSVTDITPSLEDAVLSGVNYFFGPISVAWSPQQAGLKNGGLTAVYPMSGNNLQVTATITDAIGQSLVLKVWLPGTVVDTTHGPQWTPPQVGGAGNQNPNPNPNLSLQGVPVRTIANSKGILTTGEELAAHVMLVRQFAKDKPAGRVGQVKQFAKSA